LDLVASTGKVVPISPILGKYLPTIMAGTGKPWPHEMALARKIADTGVKDIQLLGRRAIGMHDAEFLGKHWEFKSLTSGKASAFEGTSRLS
jgi:hypothetical protein